MAKLAGKYWVYVLWSDKSERHYIGVSEDVPKRLEQHNAGVSRWTRGRGPWTLRWAGEFPDHRSARRFENLLKRQKGGVGFERMLSEGP
jgi:putative endonuclease